MLSNHLKDKIAKGKCVDVLWATTASAASVGIARTLFDGVLVDGEHSPGLGVREICQLHNGFLAGQAKVPSDGEFMVRVVEPSRSIMQHLADQGVTTFVVPMVNKPEDAERVVDLVYYPSQQSGVFGGMRGAAGLMPCNAHGCVADYHSQANTQQCIITQAETMEALEKLEETVRVPGVAMTFFGPYDLHASFSLGFRMGSQEVFEAIRHAIVRAKSVSPDARFGIMEPDMSKRRAWAEIGITLFATPDVVVLRNAYGQLHEQFKREFLS